MIGEAIGNFRVVSRVGRGGMGEVYLAEQQNIGTKVAVKLLRPEISADAEHVQRFFNEARAVSRIQHAGIVKIFDVGIHPSGQAYLVMEFLEGESLARRLRRTGALTPSEVAEVGRQIASVLHATHTSGITHRDLKPDNIYLVADHELASGVRVKVLDFGIAKLTGTLAVASPQTVGTMGTPAYMAPEQWGDASKVDGRADAYSLGCVVFEMIAGRPPFLVTTLAEACGKHMTEPPPRAAELVPDVPRELDQLIAELLEKRPDDRPPSMDAITDRFAAIAERLGPPPATILPAPGAGASAAFGATMPPPALAAIGTHPPAGMGATMATESPAPARAAKPAPGVQRRTLALAGAMLGVAGASVAITALVLGGDDAADATGTCALPLPEPKLAGTSREPVVLRYQFLQDEQTEVTYVRHTTATHTDDSGTRAVDARLRLDGKLAWNPPDRGTARGQLTFLSAELDRVSETTVPGQPPTHDAVHLRSRDPEAPPAITAARNRVAWIVLDERGRHLEEHFKSVRDALTQAGAASELIATMDRDELTRLMFLEAPVEPVAVGARWKAGELLGDWQDVGTLAARFELEVAGISADQRYVLIRAAPALAIDLTGQVETLAKRTELRLWALFDRERGEIASSALGACARIEMKRDGKRSAASVELRTSYETRVIDPGKPATP